MVRRFIVGPAVVLVPVTVPIRPFGGAKWNVCEVNVCLFWSFFMLLRVIGQSVAGLSY